MGRAGGAAARGDASAGFQLSGICSLPAGMGARKTVRLGAVLCLGAALGLAALWPMAPAAARSASPEADRQSSSDGGFDARRRAVLTAFNERPFPDPVCAPGPSPERRCEWGQLSLAMSLLQTRDDAEATARADELLRSTLERLPVSTGWKRHADPRRAASSSRVDAAWDFPFLTATLLRRVVGLFGTDRPGVARRLTPEVEQAIRQVFWDWASTECRLADADPAMVWRPWGSENHDVQRVHACWAGADLLAGGEGGAGGRVYADGSTPAAQRAAWTAYWKEFIRARGRAGLSVEFFSPTYSKYLLGIFYNLLDFSTDPELRRLSEDAVTLWWAMWAQEQLDGVHGGSKARFYVDRARRAPPADDLAWVYLGLGRQAAATHPASFPMLTSRYRLPGAVQAIATDREGRGTHEVWTRNLGLAAGPLADDRYPLSPDLTAIARYAFSAPGYVMGATIVPRLPAARWSAISSQNRWNGVVLADGPDASVHATPAPPQGGRTTNNAVLAAQSRGTQIVQRLPAPFSRAAGDMAILVGPRLRRVEREGWIFVEGSAYVAARPAFGGYAADGPEPVFRLLDQRSPVVIQAGERAGHASFEAFQAAVLAAPLRADAEEVSFEGLDGAGRLRFFLDSDRRPEVDGKPLEAPSGWVLHSPYVRQAMGSGTVEVGRGARTLRLRFD
jgi:hypothetical protein